MKKPENVIKEYVGKIPDDTVKLLTSRLSQRLLGDLPEALDVLSGTHEMDRLLSQPKTCDEFFDLTDLIQSAVEKEYDKRFTLMGGR